MLISRNSKDEHILATREIENTKDFTCLHCRQKVILKKGTIKIPHFSHIEKCECDYDDYIREKCKGESQRHHAWKLHIKNELEKLKGVDRVDLEVRIGNRIADLVVHLNEKMEYREVDKFIVEIQLSKISLDKVIQRSKDYIKEGYCKQSVFWLMGEKNKNLAKNTYCGILVDNFDKEDETTKIFKIQSAFSDSENPLDIVYLEDNSCIFECGECDPFISTLEYESKLIMKEKIQFCLQFARQITNDKLAILKLIKKIQEGNKLKDRCNEIDEKLKKLQSDKIKFENNQHYYQAHVKERNDKKRKLDELRKKYKQEQNEYIELYNIEAKQIHDIANMTIEFTSNEELFESILDYEYTDKALNDKWVYYDESECVEEKAILEKFYKLAKKICEIEAITIVPYCGREYKYI